MLLKYFLISRIEPMSNTLLTQIDWEASPDFGGREFINTMREPMAQIHVSKSMGHSRDWWLMVADENGMIKDGEWAGSAGKSLREAVRKAVSHVLKETEAKRQKG